MIALSLRSVRLAAATAVALGVAASAALYPADAQQAGIEGSWSGNGQITFPSGEKESARCKASFRKAGGNSYGMNAVCATASARVVQQAQVEQLAAGRYRGEFQNPEFGITGLIRITLNGGTLNASLQGGGGSAEFSLNK